MDATGEPIPNATVTATPDGKAQGSATAQTDQNGTYAFTVESGLYELRVAEPSFTPEKTSVLATGTAVAVPLVVLGVGVEKFAPDDSQYEHSPAPTSLRPRLKALIVDGQNNHHWQETTPVLKKILEDSGLFAVTVATAPPGPDMSAFRPDFAAFDVVVSNYNGLPWPDATKAAFEKYVREGGGFVSYHAADNSFPDWPAYNEMTGVGGWAGRTTEKSGSMVRFRDGKVVLDSQPKACGNHGARLAFQVTMREPDHPIARGLPPVWMHAPDELYDSLCGPARDVGVLATAHSDPNNKGTGENEPMLMVIGYGKGRVFHTTLGHDVAAMQCVGFIATLQRGAEWAATGNVTQKAPDDFPTADRVSVRNISVHNQAVLH
jgi:type 1 glutamine amidotransferase